jgi:predicted DCC family thiol-disulfide oxidoreductase YuxK
VAPRTHDVVLFDGVCNLCNGSVQFIIAHDPAAHFRFAALQSEAARRLLSESGLNDQLPDSVALIECGRVFTRSTAALHIARRLCFPWPLLYALIVVPRTLRDVVYNLIARHRYGWFGKAHYFFGCGCGDGSLEERCYSGAYRMNLSASAPEELRPMTANAGLIDYW